MLTGQYLSYPCQSIANSLCRFAVATVMFVTTTLITIQIPWVKHKPWILAVAWLAFFGFVDRLFWGASLRKVPHAMAPGSRF